MVAEGTLPVHPGWRKPQGLDAEKSARMAAIVAAYERGDLLRAISDQFDVSVETILAYVVRAGVPMRTFDGELKASRMRAVLTPLERIERWTAAVNATPSPLMDLKQCTIDARNREDERFGGSAFHNEAR